MKGNTRHLRILAHPTPASQRWLGTVLYERISEPVEHQKFIRCALLWATSSRMNQARFPSGYQSCHAGGSSARRSRIRGRKLSPMAALLSRRRCNLYLRMAWGSWSLSNRLNPCFFLSQHSATSIRDGTTKRGSWPRMPTC